MSELDPGWEAWKARAATDPFAIAITRARDAAAGKGPGDPEWNAFFDEKERWAKRPRGRQASPGDLDSFQLPGEWPHGGDVRCRRCHLVSSLAGHPYGCPQTPGNHALDALLSCYCGSVLVVAPETLGPCCEALPPVRVPGGCRYCGSDLCRINNPDDFPEKDYYIETRHPQMGNAWVHSRCLDEHLLRRNRNDEAHRRRAKRGIPVGVYPL